MKVEHQMAARHTFMTTSNVARKIKKKVHVRVLAEKKG